MLINEQSNKGYLKIDQISIGSRKVKKGKRGERGQKWEIGPKRIILSWNANSLKWIPTRCKTVAILSMRREKRGASLLPASPPSAHPPRFSLPPPSSHPFLSSPLALHLLCLCLPTEKEFFELIFSRCWVIFPERVFTFSSVRWLYPTFLSLLPPPPTLVSFLL